MTITAPKRGDKVRLVEMVKQNAQQVLEQQRIKWLTDTKKLNWRSKNYKRRSISPLRHSRIECYDISNTQGTNSVGAMVVFEGGRPKNSEYRRFKIKQVEGPNDMQVTRKYYADASAKQLLTTFITAQRSGRRYQRPHRRNKRGSDPDGEIDSVEKVLQHDWAMPDLIIIDGGKGQLNAAMEVMRELRLDIPTIGVAKEEGSHTKMNTAEEIYIPGASTPIILPRTSQGLYLLQRIRDEAHRFSISYHRKLRSKPYIQVRT